ncbi:MAG: sigma-70 family RNA polymerase sigma factor [Verrucomicrobia bacterium]|nr:sigma-70 family RNA polymerase sigma factor [Verrucomicrobiota bacterium]
MRSDIADQTFFDELFRENYGKITGALIRKFGPDRLDLIESSIQEAFLKAIQLWPNKGFPDQPVNWLIRVASNFALDNLRGQARLERISEDLPDEVVDRPAAYFSDEVSDDDLRMLFLCCHPDLSSESQIALLLKAACGLSVKEIARAFLSTEEAVAQRLVRAKQKIRERKIMFELPFGAELVQRLEIVALSLYLLFNEGYSASEGRDLVRPGLCEEAIHLTRRLVLHPLGKLPKIHALLALMLFHRARIGTRTDPHGNLLLLKDQDRSRWDKKILQEGAEQLALAMEHGELSKYHLEAGIAALHVFAPSWEETDWAQITSYYEMLEKISPSPVVTLNRIAATLLGQGPERALIELRKSEGTLAGLNYYLYPAIAAEIFWRTGDRAEAEKRYASALRLAGTNAEKVFLASKLREVRKSHSWDGRKTPAKEE